MQFNGGGRRSAAVLLLCTLTSGLSATVCATAEEPAVSNSAERWVRWLHRQWAAYRISAWAEPGSQAPMLVLAVLPVAPPAGLTRGVSQPHRPFRSLTEPFPPPAAAQSSSASPYVPQRPAYRV